ncbi:MAG: DUF58 domain-containing protein [Propionibacteriaceae bacterium]
MTSGSAAGSTPSFRGLDLTVRRRLNGLLHGDHAGLRLGPGSEAEELTRYSPGHDVRRIDWKVTARAREPHLWLTQAEHELDTWLLLDQTPSMAFGTATQEKAELAVTITGAVGLLTAAPGNRLGVGILTSEGLTWTQPLPGRVAARRALHPAAAVPRDGVAATTLAEALTVLARRHRRPGLRMIVSDLLSPSGEFERPFDWEQPLRRLTARHDVVVVEVLDPRELELPPVGHLVLVDPESGRQRDVDTGDARIRTAYARAAAEHRSATAEAVHIAGAGHLRLRTDRDWVTDLTHFVRARSRLPARRDAPRRNAHRSNR